jgi:hypothetical protein
VCLVGRTPWSAADPPVGLLGIHRIRQRRPRSRESTSRLSLRNRQCLLNYPGMTFYRRRLPHLYEPDRSIFLTWRVHDSLPSHRVFPAGALNSGQAFAAMDRLLDEARDGPFYLRQPPIADMIVKAIQYNANILRHYLLHAFVVMPNDVHLLLLQPWHCPNLQNR